MTKRLNLFPTLLSATLGLILTGSVGSLMLRASAAEPAFVPMAVPQAQASRPIRTLPNLQTITIWGSEFSAPGGSRQRTFTFTANSPQLTAQLNDPLGAANRDYNDGQAFCDVFFSDAYGRPSPEGAYLTIEAVTEQATDQVIIAEVGLHFSNQAAEEFEYGDAISSIRANSTPGVDRLSRAIDGNRATSTILGSAYAGMRLGVTIGFLSSSGEPPCRLSINPVNQTLPSDAAKGTFEVTAQGECRWVVVKNTDNSFVSITSTVTGTGSVSYSLTANDSPSSRTEIVSIFHTDFPLTVGQSFTITQQGEVCGAFTYSITPDNLVFDSQESTGYISVSALDECRWGAFATEDWITIDGPRYFSGNGTVVLKVAPNHEGLRQGIVNVAGKRFRVNQSPTGCAVKILCDYFPRACTETLTTARSFRDEVLAKNPRGQRYTRLYYQFSTEAVRILMFNPMLMLRSREMLDRYGPVVQSMVEGKVTTLTKGDLDEIEGFLSSFAATGSTEFQDAVKGVCGDLRAPDVHSAFGITVIDGPKRELSVAQTAWFRNSIVKPVAASVGLFGLIAIGVRKRQRSALKRRARHALIALLAAFQLMSGQILTLCDRSTGHLGSSSFFGVPIYSQRSNFGIRHGNVGAPIEDTDRLSDSPVSPFARLPMSFEAAPDHEVKYITRGHNYSMMLGGTETVLALRAPGGEGSAFDGSLSAADRLRIKLLHANSSARVEGVDQLPAVSNYVMGSDPSKWRTGVPTFARVRADQVYPGIDAVYYGNEGQLEYDFIVAPRADPQAIRLGFEGVDEITVDPNGDLILRVNEREVRQRRPVVYQELNNRREEIQCRYVPIKDREIGFELGPYDHNQRLVIDPVVSYSSYLGGSGDDQGTSIAVDSAGNVYVVGFTGSPNFPVGRGTQAGFGGGQQDVFVAKLNASGNGLVYSTYIGGNGQDNGTSIAVDSSGNAYITGFTDSPNFPLVNALQPEKNGRFNAFVAKLSASGSLFYSTYLGGSVGDYGSSIAVDSSGNIYVAGIATSQNFPMANAIQSTYGGAADLYVAKLNPTGNQLLFATYLGGAGDDAATSIAIDVAGNIYLTGVTSSPNFRTAAPLQASPGGGLLDAFVCKITSGNQLVYATYLGGSGEDRAFRIAVDSAGNAYVTGDTDSKNFPIANAAQRSIAGRTDGFVAKISPSGSQLVYSTYLGGTGIDGGTAIAVDSAGSAYVTGFTGSLNFPLVDPVQQAFGGGSFDGFIAKLTASGSSLEYSTYHGGAGIDAGFGIALDTAGSAYVMGQTDSTDFPTAVPFQNANGGGPSDVFISKIVSTSSVGPRITEVSVSGKNLVVVGAGFDSGAKVLLNGEQRKTANDEQNPSTTLIAKKAGKTIGRGETVSVRVTNSDGALSNVFSFTRQ